MQQLLSCDPGTAPLEGRARNHTGNDPRTPVSRREGTGRADAPCSHPAKDNNREDDTL